MGRERTDHELDVFRRFAAIAGLSPLDGGEKRPRSEPDILFKSVTGERTAFELVELLDEEYRGRIGLLFGTKAALQSHYENLPPEKHRGILTKVWKRVALLSLLHSSDFQETQSRFRCHLDELLALPIGFEGEALEASPSLAGSLEGVTISRGRFVGPIFDPESIGWIGDPTVAAIQKKFRKTYVTPHSIELLAHIETNPMLPDEVWMTDLEEFLARQQQPLPFRRIWVFDVTAGEIKFRFPRNDL